MTEIIEALESEISSLRAPIPGAAPAGLDVALEPEFEEIKGEIDKLSSLSGGTPDWKKVIRGAEALLSTKTKDLRLVFWMTAGEVARSGWAGLARGLVVCRAFLNDFWDGMFPVRPKGRANIAVWFGERVNPQLLELPVDLQNGDLVKACAALLADIDATMGDKLGDAYGGMGSVRNTMRNRIKEIPQPPPPPPTPPPPPPTPPPPPPVAQPASTEWADDDDDDAPASEEAPAAPPPPAPAAPPAPAGPVLSLDPREAPATALAFSGALVRLAKALTDADASRAWAYRLHRAAIWLPIESPSLTFAAPDPAVREAMASLLTAGRWPELLVSAEQASALTPMWLDAQRFAALALERLGLAFVGAREVVGRDVTDLVRRWPTLLDAVFDDGTELASSETREWLREESTRWQPVTSRAEDAAKDEDAKLLRRFEAAGDLVASGQRAEGLALGAQLARRGGDPRDRFRADLRVAGLAMRAGAIDIARTLLDALWDTAEAHSLEAWEPRLCAVLYSSLVKCLDADRTEASLERRGKVFERLCRLDPGAALRLRSAASSVARAPLAPSPATQAAPSAPLAFAAPAPLAFAAPAPVAAPAQAPAEEEAPADDYDYDDD